MGHHFGERISNQARGSTAMIGDFRGQHNNDTTSRSWALVHMASRNLSSKHPKAQVTDNASPLSLTYALSTFSQFPEKRCALAAHLRVNDVVHCLVQPP